MAGGFHKWRTPSLSWQRTLKPRARSMRSEATSAENVLWSHLRGRALHGWKFRRQHAVAGYIVDFCCPAARLVVELDGTHHADQPDANALREHKLAAAGFRVLRFANRQVHDDLDSVLTAIAAAAKAANAGKETP